MHRDAIEIEVRSIKKLCGNGGHPHIVSFLRFGEVTNTHYYFLDMELCALNLDQYIHSKLSPNLLPSELTPFLEKAPPPFKSHQIWNIMQQIASGVTYLHNLSMAHRDLKPANGEPNCCIPLIYSSVIFTKESGVEIG